MARHSSSAPTVTTNCGGSETDYLEGGKGNDVFEDRGGYNIILGGQGYDSINLQGSLTQYNVANDGNTLYIRDSKGAFTIARDIEALTEKVTDYGWYKLNTPQTFNVTVNGLEHPNGGVVKYANSINGTADNNILMADLHNTWLFGKDGNDVLISIGKDNTKFVGGNGDDNLVSWVGGDSTFIFEGSFGNDIIHDFKASDKLNFIGVEGATENLDYRSFSKEVHNNTVLTFGDNSVTLVGVALDSLSSASVIIA